MTAPGHRQTAFRRTKNPICNPSDMSKVLFTSDGPKPASPGPGHTPRGPMNARGGTPGRHRIPGTTQQPRSPQACVPASTCPGWGFQLPPQCRGPSPCLSGPRALLPLGGGSPAAPPFSFTSPPPSVEKRYLYLNTSTLTPGQPLPQAHNQGPPVCRRIHSWWGLGPHAIHSFVWLCTFISKGRAPRHQPRGSPGPGCTQLRWGTRGKACILQQHLAPGARPVRWVLGPRRGQLAGQFHKMQPLPTPSWLQALDVSKPKTSHRNPGVMAGCDGSCL